MKVWCFKGIKDTLEMFRKITEKWLSTAEPDL